MHRIAIIKNIELLSRHLVSENGSDDPEYFRNLIDQSLRELALLDARETGASQDVPYSLRTGSANAGKFFASLFEACGASLFPCLIVDPRPGLQIVGVNAACELEAMKSRGDLVGRSLYDALPDNPETIAAQGICNTYAALAAAVTTGEPQVLNVQRYDVGDPAGKFRERYWTIESTPILDPDGRIAFVRQDAFNITGDVLKQAAAQA